MGYGSFYNPGSGSSSSGAGVAGTVQLTDAISGTVTVNAAAGNVFRLTCTGTAGNTRELGAATGATDGQSLRYEVTQGTSGSNLVTLGTSNYRGSDDLPLASITWSTTIGDKDVLFGVYDAGVSKVTVLAFTRGV
jgi:hypothetical protein